MNKKILILANNSGGLYGFRKELMQELISRGYEVYASTPFDDFIDELKELGVHLIQTEMDRRGMNPLKDFKLILHYRKIIKQVRPSLIITYTIKPNLYGATVARLLKVQYAINITGLGTAFQNDNFVRRMVVRWYKFVCKKVKVIFFENEGNKNTFLDFNIVNENKCCVLNGAGVNTDHFYFTEYPPITDKIHFLFIGRIMKEKGVDELFWAIEKIYENNKNIILDVVGSFEDDYEEKIKELEQNGCLHYYGYQKDVRPFIRQCHCFVLPSYHEGMANTLLESASMGRPLITSNIHGCKEAIIDGENGYLVNVKDKKNLLYHIQEFISLSYEQRVFMSHQSRIYIKEQFDKKLIVSKTITNLF